MKNITHKYKVGDYVRFKDKFSSPTTGLAGREGTIAKITGIAPSYNNKPHYYIEGSDAVYHESCFAGLATESEFLAQQALTTKVAKEQGPEPKLNTEDSGKAREEAEWIPHQEEDRIEYECSSCSWMALNDYRGRSTDSLYCPHCGKYMTNSTMEDD